MRARAMGRRFDSAGACDPDSVPGARPGSTETLLFLRGRDADARLRELDAARRGLRPVLGALACAWVDGRRFEEVGYRSLADWSREKLGVGARTVREWARVWRALVELPRLQRAVLEGEVSWSVARLVVGVVDPDQEKACLETIRGRSVRAVEALLQAVRAEPDEPGRPGSGARVRVRCSAREAHLWHAAIELARRMAGEELPVWACAERIAAEAAAAVGAPRDSVPTKRSSLPGVRAVEPGLRAQAWPAVAWRAAAGRVPDAITALAAGLEACSAIELSRRMRRVVAFGQALDLEVGRLLRQVVDRGLHRELGFARFDRYVAERLELSPRTARRLVALARSEHRAPAVATAFREGRITAMQASRLAAVDGERAASWVRRAERVTLRRLEDDLAAEPRGVIAFRAPIEVAAFFLGMVRRVGSLERLLAHAIATWVREGEAFRVHATVRRDGFRWAQARIARRPR